MLISISDFAGIPHSLHFHVHRHEHRRVALGVADTSAVANVIRGRPRGVLGIVAVVRLALRGRHAPDASAGLRHGHLPAERLPLLQLCPHEIFMEAASGTSTPPHLERCRDVQLLRGMQLVDPCCKVLTDDGNGALDFLLLAPEGRVHCGGSGTAEQVAEGRGSELREPRDALVQKLHEEVGSLHLDHRECLRQVRQRVRRELVRPAALNAGRGGRPEEVRVAGAALRRRPDESGELLGLVLRQLHSRNLNERREQRQPCAGLQLREGPQNVGYVLRHHLVPPLHRHPLDLREEQGVLQADRCEGPHGVRQLLRLEEANLRSLGGGIAQCLEELGVGVPVLGKCPKCVGDLLGLHLSGIHRQLTGDTVEHRQVASLEGCERPRNSRETLHLELTVLAAQEPCGHAGEEVGRAQGQLGICPDEV
mmetsp:Transcript_29596/g.92050  ORF Transcript_29596/g.92050 Transcript_29596/m.92050 type:complete len:423 (-) Transcript_29596:296-1564(-)